MPSQALQDLMLAYQHWRLMVLIHGLVSREPGDPDLTLEERRQYDATIHGLDATRDALTDALDHFMQVTLNTHNACQYD